MATQTEPATSAIFRALRSVHVDPDLAYEAAGENVIAAIGAKIDSQSARIDVKFLRLSPRSPRSGPKSKSRILGLTFSSG